MDFVVKFMALDNSSEFDIIKERCDVLERRIGSLEVLLLAGFAQMTRSSESAVAEASERAANTLRRRCNKANASSR